MTGAAATLELKTRGPKLSYIHKITFKSVFIFKLTTTKLLKNDNLSLEIQLNNTSLNADNVYYVTLLKFIIWKTH